MESDLREPRCDTPRKKKADGKRYEKKEIKNRQKKKKKTEPAIRDHFPRHNQKGQRSCRSLVGLSDSLLLRYPFLTTISPSALPPLSSSYHYVVGIFFPDSSGLVFQVRLGLVFCIVLFLFCVSEHISLLEDCHQQSNGKTINSQIITFIHFMIPSSSIYTYHSQGPLDPARLPLRLPTLELSPLPPLAEPSLLPRPNTPTPRSLFRFTRGLPSGHQELSSPSTTSRYEPGTKNAVVLSAPEAVSYARDELDVELEA